MNLNKLFTAVTIAGISAAPLAANAAIDIYGAANMSIYASDVENDSDLGISSNSSHIGFKGEHQLENKMKAVWKFESGVDFSGEDTTIKARNRYIGLAGNFGEVRVGNHDTPFNVVASKFDMFADTVGDRRNILGRGADGTDQFKRWAENSISYFSPAMDKVKFSGLYSTDFNSATTEADGSDDAAETLFSLGIEIDAGKATIYASYEDQHAPGNNDGNGLRVAATFKIQDNVMAGAIIETLDGPGGNSPLSRNAYGANLAIVDNKNTFKFQGLIAGDADSGGSTDALNLSAGVFHKMDKQLDVYAAATITDNGSGARYAGGAGGHDGDEIVAANNGDDITTVSVGAVYTF
jgi:predicted porin